MGRTLYRYVLFQILGPFLAGLALFTFILLVARIVKLVEMVVNRGAPVLQILKIFAYILPAFLELTVPMALLLACLLVCGRLSAENEFTAMRSAGLSLYQVSAPIAVFSLGICGASILLSLHARPWGYAGLKSGLFALARARASLGLRERVFNDEFKDLVIYVEQIRPGGIDLDRIVISDRRRANEHNTVFAQRGELRANEDTLAVTLRLFSGVIIMEERKSGAYHKTDFDEYDVSLNLADALGQLENRERAPNELPLAELRARISERGGAGAPSTGERVELFRRFSVPFACVVFSILGVALGLQPVRSVRFRGLGLSVLILLTYYLLLSAGEALAEQQRVPEAVGLWAPNALLGTLGVILFVRRAREYPALAGDRASAWLDGLIERASRARKDGR